MPGWGNPSNQTSPLIHWWDREGHRLCDEDGIHGFSGDTTMVVPSQPCPDCLLAVATWVQMEWDVMGRSPWFSDEVRP